MGDLGAFFTQLKEQKTGLLEGWVGRVLRRKLSVQLVRWVGEGGLALWLAPKIAPYTEPFWEVFWPAFQKMMSGIGVDIELTVHVNEAILFGALAALLRLLLEGGSDALGLAWTNFKEGKPLQGTPPKES